MLKNVEETDLHEEGVLLQTDLLEDKDMAILEEKWVSIEEEENLELVVLYVVETFLDTEDDFQENVFVHVVDIHCDAAVAFGRRQQLKLTFHAKILVKSYYWY